MPVCEPYYDHDGITLFQGDCLEVLPTLAARSIDAVLERKINVIPFHPHVALMAEANNIIERVSVVDIDKRTHRIDVVNIGFSGRVNLAATPTSVLVADTGGALKRTPVLAVIATVPTAPICTTRAAVTTVCTLVRAKTKAARTLHGCRDRHALTACLTGKRRNRLCRRARCYKPLFAGIEVARQRTDGNVFGAHLSRLSSKCTPANLTRQSRIAHMQRAAHRIGACTAARSLPPVFQPLRIGKIRLAAMWTISLCHAKHYSTMMG